MGRNSLTKPWEKIVKTSVLKKIRNVKNVKMSTQVMGTC